MKIFVQHLFTISSHSERDHTTHIPQYLKIHNTIQQKEYYQSKPPKHRPINTIPSPNTDQNQSQKHKNQTELPKNPNHTPKDTHTRRNKTLRH